MKKLIVLSLGVCLAYANEALELYQKAAQFEKAGDTQNALLYYKKAAANSLNLSDENGNKSLNLDNKIALNEPEIIENSTTKQAENSDDTPYNLLNISPLYDNYILPFTYASKVPNGGSKNKETKFQISVKKPLLEDFLGLKESLYFGYTQTSWWQTTEESTPFRESNYQPEFFVDFPLNFGSLKSAQIGILHTSNGQGGEKSRSWNRIYARGEFVYGDLSIYPRLWWRIPESDDDNPDIRDYAGNGDINFVFKLNKHYLNAKFTNNLHLDKTNRGSLELGWVFPIFSSGLYGYVQYFNGYAQSLIEYDKHTNKIGVGFLLFR
ncbi:phospholipase A1 [Campylobacter iguaniorum]|uniref:phospholipase A n=1 Tax=Campylobacter iguaniorum TaxID=1244531 RepID=UPI00073A3F56|nr:phospholipase A [Campylobacter iguaniorum]ALV23820.1 phospholipase A1 [Campylobacter iguaniorum]